MAWPEGLESFSEAGQGFPSVAEGFHQLDSLAASWVGWGDKEASWTRLLAVAGPPLTGGLAFPVSPGGKGMSQTQRGRRVFPLAVCIWWESP